MLEAGARGREDGTVGGTQRQHARGAGGRRRRRRRRRSAAQLGQTIIGGAFGVVVGASVGVGVGEDEVKGVGRVRDSGAVSRTRGRGSRGN